VLLASRSVTVVPLRSSFTQKASAI
jgi:hypothetical protein